MHPWGCAVKIKFVRPWGCTGEVKENENESYNFEYDDFGSGVLPRGE